MSELGQKHTSDTQTSMFALPPKADIHRHDGDVRFVPNSEVAASFDQAPSMRNVGGISGVSAHASRARTSRVHSGALLNAPTLPRVGTRGIIFFRSQLRNSIWDRSVKLSGLYRSGARHASATDLTQYLLANLIVRVENTGFSYASPGPLDPGLIASRSLRGTAPSEDQDETLVQQPACQIPGGTSLRSNSQLVEI